MSEQELTLEQEINEYLARFVIAERKAFATALINARRAGQSDPAVPADLMRPTAKGKVPGEAIVKRVNGLFRKHAAPQGPVTQPAVNVTEPMSNRPTSEQVATQATLAHEQRVALLRAAGLTDEQIAAIFPAPVAQQPAPSTNGNGHKPRSAKQLANDARLAQQARDRAAQKRGTQHPTPSPAVTTAVLHSLADLATVRVPNPSDQTMPGSNVVQCPSCGTHVRKLYANMQATTLNEVATNRLDDQGQRVDHVADPTLTVKVCPDCRDLPGENILRAIASRVKVNA